MGSEWKTDEDFFNDLMNSEYTDPIDIPGPEPKTITEWKKMNSKKNTPAVFDSEFAEEDDRFISGRGRGQPDRIVRPGTSIQSSPTPAVFDSEFAEEDDRFISGRGRGQPDRIVRPGTSIQRSRPKPSVEPWKSKRVQEKKLLLEMESESDFPPFSNPAE